MQGELPFGETPEPAPATPGEPTDEALHLAAAFARDDLHARLLVMQFGLAARTHPDLLRDALAGVFDLTAFRELASRVSVDVHVMMRLAEECRVLIEAVRLDLDRLEEQYDRITVKAAELNGRKKS